MCYSHRRGYATKHIIKLLNTWRGWLEEITLNHLMWSVHRWLDSKLTWGEYLRRERVTLTSVSSVIIGNCTNIRNVKQIHMHLHAYTWIEGLYCPHTSLHVVTCDYKKETISTREQQLGKCRGYQVLQRDNNDILLCNSPLLGLMVTTNGI